MSRRGPPEAGLREGMEMEGFQVQLTIPVEGKKISLDGASALPTMLIEGLKAFSMLSKEDLLPSYLLYPNTLQGCHN